MQEVVGYRHAYCLANGVAYGLEFRERLRLLLEFRGADNKNELDNIQLIFYTPAYNL